MFDTHERAARIEAREDAQDRELRKRKLAGSFKELSELLEVAVRCLEEKKENWVYTNNSIRDICMNTDDEAAKRHVARLRGEVGSIIKHSLKHAFEIISLLKQDHARHPEDIRTAEELLSWLEAADRWLDSGRWRGVFPDQAVMSIPISEYLKRIRDLFIRMSVKVVSQH